MISYLIFLFFSPSWWKNESEDSLRLIYPNFGKLVFIYKNILWQIHGILALLVLLKYAKNLFSGLNEKAGINSKINLFKDKGGFYFKRFQRYATENVLQPRIFISSLFFRSLALVYLVAFSSLIWQIELVTERGLIPYEEFARSTLLKDGYSAFLTYPSVFWISQSNWFICLVLLSGCFSALYSVFFRPKPILYLLLWFLYLSVVSFGRDLFQFPWDTFLLEIGFISFVIAFFIQKQNKLPRYLFFAILLLFFRQWFSMAMTKWLWSDPTWYNLTYMKYYWLNNPSPTPLAPYMYGLPMWVQKIITALSLICELMIPLLLFFGKKGRKMAFLLSFLLSLFIQLTGNFGFFNLLTVILGFWCLEDGFFRKATLPANTIPSGKRHNVIFRYIFPFLISAVITFNFYYLTNLFIKQNNHAYINNHSLADKENLTLLDPGFYFFETGKFFSRFRIVSPHGVFKNIPRKRIHMEIYIRTSENSSWQKLHPLKGLEVINFSFSAPNMNRLPFIWFYQSYGKDFRPGLRHLNPNTNYLNPWVKNLIQGIFDNNPEIGKLINIPKNQHVEEIKITQIVYNAYSELNCIFIKKVVADSICIKQSDSFPTPLFKSNLPKIFKFQKVTN